MKPEHIKKVRGRMTRETFAALVGTSSITIWRWENGASKPEGAALRLLELLSRNRKQVLGHLMAITEEDFKRSLIT